ncbi:stage III sporulation protein SpoIIIAB [Clostridiaceae bacterium 35-E11]
MLVKLILASIIILSTASIGYILAYRYVQRIYQLKNLYVSFQLLETEIIYASNALPIAMLRVAEKSHKSISEFFIETYKILSSKAGYSAEEAWNKAINNHFINTALTNEDKETLMDFGKNLGCTDKENQAKNFHLIYLQLKKQQEIAEGLRIKNEKMCKSLGVLIGIAIVVIFI